ncbi:MAG: NAD-dependent dehydratase [Arenimonas sp.]
MGLNERNLLLAGATGLVGGLVLRQLLAAPRFNGVVYAPVRRDPGIVDARLSALTSNFAPGSGDLQLSAAIEARGARPLDAYVSCLGTTLRAAGSREAFIAVDRDLVLRLAQLAYDHGARHAVLVSSVGASRQSGSFYLRVKGEVEDAVAKIGFTRLDLIQPGLLLGPRNERRPAERLAQALAPLTNALMQGALQRYRSISASEVAAAIVRLLPETGRGVFSHRYQSLRVLAAAAPARH